MGEISNVVCWHCIRCGRTWGGDEDFCSHGVCIGCLAEWINMKRRVRGLIPCFGRYRLDPMYDCDICDVKDYCYEYINDYEELNGLSM